MINYIFGSFFLIGIIYAFLSGNIPQVNESILTSGSTAITMTINLIPLLCLWMGVMQIASKSGLLEKLSKVIAHIIGPLFPEIDKTNEALTYIASSIVMNIFGLGNAATPFGLKAFEVLQEKNPKKDTATRSMITFLVITTSSVTLIPTTIISFRNLNHSANPTEILIPCIIATILSSIFGLIIDRIFANIWRGYD